MRFPEGTSPASALRPVLLPVSSLNLFQKFHYYNFGLSVMGCTGYFVSSLMLSGTYSLSYLVFCFCCIQIACGLDNILDIGVDQKTWKKEVIPEGGKNFRQAYACYLCLMALLATVVSIPFINSVLYATLPAALVLFHSLPVYWGGQTISLKTEFAWPCCSAGRGSVKQSGVI